MERLWLTSKNIFENELFLLRLHRPHPSSHRKSLKRQKMKVKIKDVRVFCKYFVFLCFYLSNCSSASALKDFTGLCKVNNGKIYLVIREINFRLDKNTLYAYIFSLKRVFGFDSCLQGFLKLIILEICIWKIL